MKSCLISIRIVLFLLSFFYLGNQISAQIKSFVYQGIQVSSAQKSIDWDVLTEDKNIKLVYVKASDGAELRDLYYAENMAGAKRIGLNAGSCHLFTASPVADQFANFIECTDSLQQDLVPLIEVDKSSFHNPYWQDSLQSFVDQIEARIGRKPMICIDNDCYNEHLSYRFRNHPLMICCQGGQKPQLKDQGNYLLWRFSEKGIVRGIKRPVSLSRFNSTASLTDLLIRKNE